MSKRFDLSGKVALVTGASSGLGVHFARTLASAGASVVVAARRADRLASLQAELRQGGAKALAVDLDVQSADSITAAFDKVEAALGPLDILVNNAGISIVKPALDMPEADWDAVVDTNLRGAWLCSQIVCRRVTEAKRQASIVNIGSIQAAKVLPGRTHYAPTKLGLEALTRNMSAEMTYTSKEMIDYLIKGVSGEFGRSRFTREFNTTTGGAGQISQ